MAQRQQGPTSPPPLPAPPAPQISETEKTVRLSGAMTAVEAAKAHITRLFLGYKPEVHLVAFADSLVTSGVPEAVFSQGAPPLLCAGCMCACAANVGFSAHAHPHPLSTTHASLLELLSPTPPPCLPAPPPSPPPPHTHTRHALPARAALRLLPPADPLLAALTDAMPLAADVTLARTKLGVRVEGPASQVALALGVVTGRVQALAAKLLVHTIRGSCDMEARHLQASASLCVGPGVLPRTLPQAWVWACACAQSALPTSVPFASGVSCGRAVVWARSLCRSMCAPLGTSCGTSTR